jgi:colicin import membrane protein
MPRKLKTYITNLGFFELALAAPSMKAALDAWGMGHNTFHQGFAKETHDAKIVAATMAMPGTVLRRPVGTKGEFKENAELPKQLGKLTPPKIEPQKRKAVAVAKRSAKTKGVKESKPQAAILSFEKAKARRDRERQRAQAKEDAERDRKRARIERAAAKAEDALERARERHEEKLAAIAQERKTLERRVAVEDARWNAERAKLEEARELAVE